jgi:uncharacterized membrane protein
MSGLPLHPILVHFPIAISFLLPLAALIALIAGYRQGDGRKPWLAVVLLQGLLLGSAFAAAQAGERDEEMVERVLAAEEPLEVHEDAGELLVKAVAAAFALALLGMGPGRWGRTGRALASVAFLAVLALGLRAGHTGGKLVYEHGAEAAFTQGAVPALQESQGKSHRESDP